MITRAKFQNFKALRDVEITFDSRLTVLVGPNGSGKTSVLQGIHALTQLAVVPSNDPDFQLSKLVEYCSIGVPTGLFELQINGSRLTGEYIITIETRPSWIGGTLSILKEDGRPDHWQVESRYHCGQWLDPDRPSNLRPGDAAKFDQSAFIRFSAGQLAAPALVRTNPPRVSKDGSGLAATLSHIRDKHKTRFDAIIEAFRRVIPDVKVVRFDKELVPQTDVYGDSLLVDYQGVAGVKASHVSSGTLFALGLLTVTLGADSANVILLDDLDHGLHPKAQMELVEVFRGLIEQNPDLQIIATSHSPYILHHLEWNEVRVTALQDDGSAICKPLTDHPEVDRWREAMTPGEFWSTFYEDWLTKSRKPQPVP
jgi:predicted ATPase